MHQCVHCNSQYGDDNKELLSGCACGSKFFFYVREEVSLSNEQKAILESVAQEHEDEEPSVISLEAIRVEGDEFTIDLDKLFSENIVITKIDDAYLIDISQ